MSNNPFEFGGRPGPFSGSPESEGGLVLGPADHEIYSKLAYWLLPLGLVAMLVGILTCVAALVIVLFNARDNIIVGAAAYLFAGSLQILQGSWMRSASIAFRQFVASGGGNREPLMEGMRNLHYLFRLWGVFLVIGLALISIAVLLALVLPALVMMRR